MSDGLKQSELKQSLFPFTLEVSEFVEQEDGSAIIWFDTDPAFKTWFMEWQNLKRWSRRRFEKVIVAALEAYVKKVENEHEINNIP